MATNIINDTTVTPIGALAPEAQSESVLYVEQELTPAQQMQARQNMGVAGRAQVAYLGMPVGQV